MREKISKSSQWLTALPNEVRRILVTRTTRPEQCETILKELRQHYQNAVIDILTQDEFPVDHWAEAYKLYEIHKYNGFPGTVLTATAKAINYDLVVICYNNSMGRAYEKWERWAYEIRPALVIGYHHEGYLALDVGGLKYEMERQLDRLERKVNYLEYENSRLSSMVRYLAEPVIDKLPLSKQTRDSFNFQWGNVPTGRHCLENELFWTEAPDNVQEFTGLPASWFKGKSVIDVGCGAGRYSWALNVLGATVMSVDQSDYALAKTAKVCREFQGHRTMKVDLLKPLSIRERFDLVWCFGVLHHTGATWRAFKNVAPLVQEGGYLYLMLYGEPRKDFPIDYDEMNEYFFWREQTVNMPLQEKLTTVIKGMQEGKFAGKGDDRIHGYFDAISPTINDLYRLDEIEGWLIKAGFSNLRRTVESRNHHIIANRSE